jgi:hypothetical protein
VGYFTLNETITQTEYISAQLSGENMKVLGKFLALPYEMVYRKITTGRWASYSGMFSDFDVFFALFSMSIQMLVVMTGVVVYLLV